MNSARPQRATETLSLLVSLTVTQTQTQSCCKTKTALNDQNSFMNSEVDHSPQGQMAGGEPIFVGIN